jgi:hypothetical protein
MDKLYNKTFKLLIIPSLLVLFSIVGSCNISNPVTIISTETTTGTINANTTSVDDRFIIIDCPDQASVGSYITIKARVANYSATIAYELSLEQAVEGATNINRVLYSGNCEADNENIILWYFQIPIKAYTGIANISIVADEGLGEVFNHNIIIRE